MRILIASDLHGNLEALNALPNDYDEFWVLGDLVNYGPNPQEVTKFVQEHASLVVRGNHDDSFGFGHDPQCSAPYRLLAEETALCTRHTMKESELEFLRQLPLITIRHAAGARFLACHATPDHPLHEYRAAASELWIKEPCLALIDVLLVGHTHIPLCRRAGAHLIANPGSVGLSKVDGGRARYAIWEEGNFQLHSIEYPVEDTIAKLHRLPLSKTALRQLSSVLRTGSLGSAEPRD